MNEVENIEGDEIEIKTIEGKKASKALESEEVRKALVANLSQSTREVMQHTHYELEEIFMLQIEGIDHHLDDVMKENNIIVATIDEMVVGMTAIIKVRDQEDMYEIGRVSVLPDAQRKGVGQKLMDAALKRIKTLYKTASILITTKNDKVKTWAEQNSFVPIGMQAHEDRWHNPPKPFDREYAKHREDQGWNCFEYTPDRKSDA